METKERRRHPRVPLVTKVTHLKHDVYQYYYSRDLSLSGIFLETKSPYAVGTGLELEFSLPTGNKRIRIEGKVARIVEPGQEKSDLDPGMGISFIAVPQESKEELAAFLKSEIED